MLLGPFMVLPPAIIRGKSDIGLNKAAVLSHLGEFVGIKGAFGKRFSSLKRFSPNPIPFKSGHSLVRCVLLFVVYESSLLQPNSRGRKSHKCRAKRTTEYIWENWWYVLFLWFKVFVAVWTVNLSIVSVGFFSVFLGFKVDPLKHLCEFFRKGFLFLGRLLLSQPLFTH